MATKFKDILVLLKNWKKLVIEKKIYFVLLFLSPLYIFCLLNYQKIISFLQKDRIGCPIQLRWGIYCPGCGGTRALISLFHLHIIQSFLYHPIILVVVILFLAFMITHTISLFHPSYYGMEIKIWHGLLIIVTIIANFVIRNILLAHGIPTL